jgi:D-3-phosphoglycerate dehydrogenase
VIGGAGAGTDHVDLTAAARHGVAVTHTPGSNADAVAEFALAQLLALTRNLAAHDEAAHDGRWSTPAAPAAELSELTLGIAGLGRIGRALADRAAALGMAVQGFSRRPAPAEGTVRRVASLEELLATSDVVSVHLPLTERTRRVIGRAEPALMRPGAILLNTARGGIVASPLSGLPGALLTPHIAGMTRRAMAEAALRCADHIAALLAGRPDGVPVATR